MLRSKKHYYWYNDEYMYFYFNGQHSSKYNLFIQNSKALTIENTVGAASEYSNAIMQEGTYYLGTSRKQKTFKRKCAAEGLTLDEYKRMMQWLTVGTTGELSFDSDKYWGWTVVLDTIGDATVSGNNDFLIVEFELTFKTIGTYLAHNIYPATWLSVDELAFENVIGTNQYGIPTAIVVQTNPKEGETITTLDCYIQNISNAIQEFQLEFQLKFNKRDDDDLRIKECEFDIKRQENDITYLSAKFVNIANPNFEYNSSMSALYAGGTIAEENTACIYTTQNNGMIKLKSQAPVELYTKSSGVVFSGNAVTLHLDDESFNDFVMGDYHYVCVSARGDNSTLYGTSSYAIEDGESYTSDMHSIFATYNKDLSLNGIASVCTIDSEKKTIMIRLAREVDKKFFTTTNCRIYCGYMHHIQACIEADAEITRHSMTVVSYNNL